MTDEVYYKNIAYQCPRRNCTNSVQQKVCSSELEGFGFVVCEDCEKSGFSCWSGWGNGKLTILHNKVELYSYDEKLVEYKDLGRADVQ